ncbi:uncharacterized protein [Hetaerina americana]|uniref:uncharacterized protein isoform X2 n=1 Tax=Hetaerina americana TaxID=62018 RepID=UPI003A7F20D9
MEPNQMRHPGVPDPRVTQRCRDDAPFTLSQSGPSSSELPAAQNSFSNSGSNNPSSTSGQPLDAEHQLPRLTGHRHQQLALGVMEKYLLTKTGCRDTQRGLSV